MDVRAEAEAGRLVSGLVSGMGGHLTGHVVCLLEFCLWDVENGGMDVENGLWVSHQGTGLPCIGQGCPFALLLFSLQWTLPGALAHHCHRGRGM